MKALPRALPLLLCLLLAPDPGRAGGNGVEEPSSCVRAAVDQVQQRYETIQDMRADFEQVTRSVAFGGSGAAPSRGQVEFARPGRMRWSYEEPEPSLMLSDGVTLWLYDPTRKEAQKLPVKQGYVSGASIQFLLGQGRILEQFSVVPRRCDEEAALLELRPRQDEAFEKLSIEVDRATGDLRKTVIVDLLGNVTEVSFSQIRVNTGVDAERFRFEPGEDVRVVEIAPTLAP